MNKKLLSVGLCIIVAIFIFGSLGFRFRSPITSQERVIKITARKFDFSPGEITVKKGETVVLEITSSDRVHGFSLPDFKLKSKIKPNEVTRLKFAPDKTGHFTFSCDVFCGRGHKDMSGTLTVLE